MKTKSSLTKKTIVTLAFTFMAGIGAASPGCDCNAHASDKTGSSSDAGAPLTAIEVSAPAQGCTAENNANRECSRWYEIFEKANPDACISDVRQAGKNCGRWYSMGTAPVKEVVLRTNQVHFEFNKSRILPQSHPVLNEVAATIRRSDVQHVTIEGHTDSKGSDAYNEKLSDQRAASVREYLGSHGISSEEMSSVGKGESEPIAENEINGKDNRPGRDLNRRVEFHLQLKPFSNVKMVKGEQGPTFPEHSGQVSSR